MDTALGLPDMHSDVEQLGKNRRRRIEVCPEEFGKRIITARSTDKGIDTEVEGWTDNVGFIGVNTASPRNGGVRHHVSLHEQQTPGPTMRILSRFNTCTSLRLV